jgi:hypothetical protein
MDTEVMYYHGETNDGYRFTIAGRFQPMLINDIDNDQDVIMLGISLCGAGDQFAKKLGRIRAAGRMKSKSILGRTYFSLYQETQPLNWFADKKGRVFVEAAQLNSALSRASLMRKFNL